MDSQLARETGIAVEEMLNGCMCCVLVGQMETALRTLKSTGPAAVGRAGKEGEETPD